MNCQHPLDVKHRLEMTKNKSPLDIPASLFKKPKRWRPPKHKKFRRILCYHP